MPSAPPEPVVSLPLSSWPPRSTSPTPRHLPACHGSLFKPRNPVLPTVGQGEAKLGACSHPHQTVCTPSLKKGADPQLTPDLGGGDPQQAVGGGTFPPSASKPFPKSWNGPRTRPRTPAPVGVSPAHERDFQILSSSKMMARRWERSPRNRKRFMVGGVWKGWREAGCWGTAPRGGCSGRAAGLEGGRGALGWPPLLGGDSRRGSRGGSWWRSRSWEEGGGPEGEESGREAPPRRAESRLSGAPYPAPQACRVRAECHPQDRLIEMCGFTGI